MANIQISTRSRNIGIGWTNQPVQTRGGLVIQDVEAPSVVGTRNQILAEYNRALRGNSGNDWRVAWFVGGRRVLAVDPMSGVSFLYQLREMTPAYVVEWPLDDDDAPALMAAAAEERRAADEMARQWRLANGYAYPEDEDMTQQDTATRSDIADALRDFGWIVADYGDPADHYAVHVREDEGDMETPSCYVVSFTQEGMPPFETLEFATLDALSIYVAAHYSDAIWREDGE